MKSRFIDPLAKSRWLTTGWTLQELIAPLSVIFLENSWDEIETKSSLQGLLSDITGINRDMFFGGSLETFSIAQRMSWASKLQTTRLEGFAYKLQPHGYIQRQNTNTLRKRRASLNRQLEEIMKALDHCSIFAWKSENSFGYDGLLARSPAAFTTGGNIIYWKIFSGPFTVTNKGIRLDLSLMVDGKYGYYLDMLARGGLKNHDMPYGQYLAFLDCRDLHHPDMLLGIWLRDLSNPEEGLERFGIGKLG